MTAYKHSCKDSLHRLLTIEGSQENQTDHKMFPTPQDN
jgi:hypothetical protein